MAIIDKIKKPIIRYLIILFCYLLYTGWEQFLGFGGGEFDSAAAASYFIRLIDKLAYLKRHDVSVQLVIILVSMGLGIGISTRLQVWVDKISEYEKTLLYLINAVVLFVSFNGFKTYYYDYGFNGISLSFINVFFVTTLTFAGAGYLIKYDSANVSIINGYKEHIGVKIAYYLMWIFITFMCAGEYLFLSDLNKAWTFNTKTLSLFIMFMLWLKPFIDYILVALEKRQLSFKTKSGRLSIKENAIVWGLMILPLGIYFLLAYPAIESVDSVGAWGEIKNQAGYTYGCPRFVKIVWQMLYSIWPSFAIVTIFQCVLWMLTVYMYLRLFAKRGMKKMVLYIIAFVTCAFTPFNLFVLMHSTNIYYVLAMLWAVYFFVRYFEGDVNKYLWIIGMSCCLVLLPLTRNEGTIALAIIVAFSFLYAVLKRKLLPGIATVIAVVLSLIVKGPVFDAFGASSVSLSNNNGINILINDITIATVHFDGNLSNESRTLLNKYASDEEIDAMWRNFDYDSVAPAKLSPFITNKSEVFPVAKDSIIHNIPIAIRERLNKSENVWNVTQYKDAVNARRSVNAKENESLIYRILFRVLYYPTFMIPVLDILLYRSGIWLCFMLILSVYLIKNKRGEEMLIYAPAIAHAIVLVLSLLWLCARHTWCINLTGMVLVALEFGCGGRCAAKQSAGGESDSAGECTEKGQNEIDACVACVNRKIGRHIFKLAHTIEERQE